MQSKSIFIVPGLVSVFLFSALWADEGLRAQQPSTATPQTQVQVRLLELQKRQFEEQGKEQIEQLEEVAKEQIEQVKGEANRQIQQLQSLLARQSQQIRSTVKRQSQLLDIQMKILETQPGMMKPSAEEKLDKILDRLERLEKRLDMLEKRK
jgi:hypothetical protein